jgi:aspartyl-tRNA(Asn)/glutamyl-tRNA(Gln) amidotransferase subunit B
MHAQAGMEYEAVIGLEVHAELLTQSKMFCACPVVDSTVAAPNTAVCPVCAGMPGVLPVVNERAVEYALRVALALDCRVNHTSIFARKNYFYPDLPKGYQISQYEYPLAEHGRLAIPTSGEERVIRIRRVHLEEDTGKLTHVPGIPALATEGGPTLEGASPVEGSPPQEGRQPPAGGYSLVDLNRAGVALLEIVSEPDMHSVEEVRAYAEGLRAILRTLGVNSGDMEKGVIRFEANVSVRPVGSTALGTRVEIKNLNSFRALERATAYQIAQQTALARAGQPVRQETLGWDEARGITYAQRSKEEAHDYRYFPEPDLPPLVVEQAWIERVASELPELPGPRARRFQQQYGLSAADARTLAQDKAVADYFEAVIAATAVTAAGSQVQPRAAANWITGEIFGWLNQTGKPFQEMPVSPERLAELLRMAGSEINLTTAKAVLAEMLESGKAAGQIIQERGLQQISDREMISGLVRQVLEANPQELAAYRSGKTGLAAWFFGQVMRAAQGRANPQVVRAELEALLAQIDTGRPKAQ